MAAHLRPRTKIQLNNYAAEPIAPVATVQSSPADSVEIAVIPYEGKPASTIPLQSESKEPKQSVTQLLNHSVLVATFSSQNPRAGLADPDFTTCAKATAAESNVLETTPNEYTESNSSDGFFHHKLVPFRGASATIRGNKFFVGSSKTPREASANAVARRREWLIEKRNYERKLEAYKKKGPFCRRGEIERDDPPVSEHYIPEALPVDEEELFAGVKDRQTGRYIDDLMEETMQCEFLGLETPAPKPPPMAFTVAELQLMRKLRENLLSMSITELLPIQRQVIPIIRAGFDVIGASPTGSGKTAAFLVPIIEDLLVRKGQDPRALPSTKAIILCPTRELAAQIYQTAVQLASSTKLTCVAVYGAIDSQFLGHSLKVAPDVIIGTPGRMLDVINAKMVSLLHIRYLVVDEVDRMIAGKSFPEVTAILDHNTFPGKDRCQTLFFSATIPDEETIVLKRNQARPFLVRVGQSGLALGVTHVFEKTQGYFEKIDKLRIHLDAAVADSKSVLVFAGTKATVDRLHSDLKGFSHLISHGFMEQADRADVMRRFTSGEIPVVVATDLCSRGLDIEKVNMIINFNMPRSSADYIHRIGRTGRVGHTGTAVTFYDPASKWDGNALEVLADKLKANGVTLPTWIDQEINLVRHSRLNSARRLVQKEELVYQQGDADDLADLGIFLCWGASVPVVTNEWLREW